MKKRMNFILSLFLFFGLALHAQTLEDGLTLITNENFPEARKVFKSLMAADPKAPEPYFYLGETHFLYDNLDSAQYYYKLGDDNVPGRSKALIHVGFGKVHYTNHKKKEARDEFEKAEKANRRAQDWRVPYEIGRVYLEDEDRDLEMAIMKFTEAKDLARENPAPFIKLGDAYMAKYEGGNAANQYDYVLNRLNMQLPEIYQKKAMLFKRSRSNDLAIENLKKAIEVDPNYAPAYRDLIEIYQEEKVYEKVTPLLETYTNLVADDIEAKVRFVGFLFRQARNYERTIEEADKVLAIEPDNYRMHRWKGYAQVELGQFKEGRKSLLKFFDLVGDDRTYFTDFDYYARAAVAMEEFEEAEEKYRKALDFDIDKAEIYDKIAKMYYTAKKYPQAAAAYKDKILSVDPVSTDYFYMGYSLFMMQQYEAADSAFASVTEVLPEWVPGYVLRAKCNEYLDPELDSLLAKPFHVKVIELAAGDLKKHGGDLINAHKYLGFVAFNENDLDTAKMHFESLLEIAELDKAKFENTLAETYGNLGYIYFQSKDKEGKLKSRKYYENLLEIEPENETALNAIELLKDVKG
jgi:tetratricopeptide (TPR) repeat protein